MTERRVELTIALVPVLLVAVTLLFLLDPAIPTATLNAPLDMAINTFATLVAVAVAVLGWVHFREDRDAATLLRASAFLVLATVNAVFIAIAAAGVEDAFGSSLERPGQLPILAVLVSRGTAGFLLLGAGFAGRSGWRADRWPSLLVVWGPALATLAIISLGAAMQASLPQVIGAAELEAIRTDPTAPLVAFGARGLVAMQVVIGIAFLGGAALAYWTYRIRRQSLDAFLAVGLVDAAFSQVQSAIHPGVYAGLVTLGDLERVAFYLILFVALAAQSREEVRALRRANAELTLLRDADLARAAVDERARLAREIHDGMSQDLWYAKLKQARLVALDLPAEARALAGEVSTALESALAEARQAVLALRPAEDASFGELLQRYADDFADRFGIPVECRCEAVADSLPPRSQAELLRIAQEALTNARKHADPTVVRVSLSADDGRIVLAVADNGRGFDPQAVNTSGYGLQAMRERADLIGGRLAVETTVQGGTLVTVVVPGVAGP